MKPMPDALGAVIAYLDASSDLSTVDVVSADLTGYVDGETWIVVEEAPGRQIIETRLTAPLFNFNVYADTIENARRICVITQAVMVQMRGYTTSDIVVTAVSTTTTPFKFTDFVNNQPRYVFSAEVYCRPN